MRRGYLLVGLACALLAAESSHLLALDEAGAADRAASRWEYRVIALEDLAARAKDDAEEVAAVESRFGELGEEGWEFCGQVGLAVVFKRPGS